MELSANAHNARVRSTQHEPHQHLQRCAGVQPGDPGVRPGAGDQGAHQLVTAELHVVSVHSLAGDLEGWHIGVRGGGVRGGREDRLGLRHEWAGQEGLRGYLYGVRARRMWRVTGHSRRRGHLLCAAYSAVSRVDVRLHAPTRMQLPGRAVTDTQLKGRAHILGTHLQLRRHVVVRLAHHRHRVGGSGRLGVRREAGQAPAGGTAEARSSGQLRAHGVTAAAGCATDKQSQRAGELDATSFPFVGMPYGQCNAHACQSHVRSRPRPILPHPKIGSTVPPFVS